MIHRISTFGLRAAAFAAVVFAVPAMHAAGPADAANGSPATPSVSSIFTVNVPNPTRDVRYETAGFSSSNDDAAPADANGLFGESYDGAQPPPSRRSYGRSRNGDRGHNPDGSNRWAFMAGAGAAVPAGNTANYYTPSYTIGGGAGINFNKTFGILGEFHYDHMGLTGNSINTEYNNLLAYGFTPSDLSGFDANAHVISITANPIINFAPASRSGRLGAYITGGVGWYHKVTNFTIPELGTSCSFYCIQYYENVNIDSASANAFGANLGFGLTYKLSEFSSERLFMESRYTWLAIGGNNNQDFFPYARRNTEYFPVTVGIRF